MMNKLPDNKVFIIAEAGVNHNGSTELAKKNYFYEGLCRKKGR